MASSFTPDHAPLWGPSGEVVYDRTYSRPKPDGTKETWAETVERVVKGNLALVDPRHIEPGEFEALCRLIYDFKAIPAGRHLWASGVPGRQYLFNCHVSGWGETFSRHFRFTFLRLMEGGGVGANYSSRFLRGYGAPKRFLAVHIVCDPQHPDYEVMRASGLLSEDYSPDWAGAFEVGDSREGWADAMTDLMDTYFQDDDPAHAARVYDVSNVRERGRRLKSFGGYASGPEPFARMMLTQAATLNAAAAGPLDYVNPIAAMSLDHAIAECVVSGGNRRSARMAIVEWDDPFIYDFLRCKADHSSHWTTNISVGIDDTFIRAINGDTSVGSVWAGKARAVHKLAVEAMLANGEPGYWNRSLSQEGETGEVIATNPCGEITLEAWENCNLGHVNLSAFVDEHGVTDTRGLVQAHDLMARFLVRATYGDVTDEGQAERLAANRRIGVGHFGVQGYLAKRGVAYSAAPSDGTFLHQLRHWKSVVRRSADAYAFQLRIPAPVKVTTVAPTGTIAKLPGATEGIHPIYARHFIRRIRFAKSDPDQARKLDELRAEGYLVERDIYDPSGETMVAAIPTKESLVGEVEALGFDADLVESANELSLMDMLRFQVMYQDEYADNAVSFTVNFPEGKLSPEDVGYSLARMLFHLKGTTLMPDGTRPQAPYERITEAEYLASGARTVADSTDEECANGACPVR